jgi:2-keto-3-deoxy-L-rhamnonate aldolase RhmA
MRENEMKRILGEGRAVIGSIITVPDPMLAEVMGEAGFDFLVIDTEHSPITINQLQTLLIALRSSRSTLLVRAPWNDPVAVKQILDVGAEGVIIPWVSTRAESEQAVASTRYPPDGIRGFGPRRAARVAGGAKEYVRKANENILTLVQIERGEAAVRLDEILTTPGLDGIMVGPADLAASLGYINDLENEGVEALIRQVLEGCQKRAVPFGMFTGTPEKARQWIGLGGRIATIGSDMAFVDAGIAQAKRDAALILER